MKYQTLRNANTSNLLNIAQNVHKQEMKNKIHKNSRMFYKMPQSIKPKEKEALRKRLMKWYGINTTFKPSSTSKPKSTSKPRSSKKTIQLNTLPENTLYQIFNFLPLENHLRLQQTSKPMKNKGTQNKMKKVFETLQTSLKNIIQHITDILFISNVDLPSAYINRSTYLAMTEHGKYSVDELAKHAKKVFKITNILPDFDLQSFIASNKDEYKISKKLQSILKLYLDKNPAKRDFTYTPNPFILHIMKDAIRMYMPKNAKYSLYALSMVNTIQFYSKQ